MDKMDYVNEYNFCPDCGSIIKYSRTNGTPTEESWDCSKCEWSHEIWY